MTTAYAPEETARVPRSDELTRHERLLSRLGERGHLLEAQLRALDREFAGTVSRSRIVSASDDVLEQLIAQARFTHFVPVLAYRYTRERLMAQASRADA